MPSASPASPDHTPDVTAAMRAGIAEAELLQCGSTRSALPGAVLPHVGAAQQLPLYRRVGRRALRMLRPFVLPLLTRLQGRVRAGVDDSLTAQRSIKTLEGLNAIRAETARLAERLGRVETAVAEHLAGMEQALVARLATLEGRPAAPLPRQPPPLAMALGTEMLVRTPYGWLLAPAEDVRLITEMVETGGLLEPGTATVVQAVLEPGDFAVDVGAHVGMLTLAMAHAVGPAGHVLAIEPTPRLAALLRRSATLTFFAEGIIAVEACALGAEPGTAILSIGQTNGHNSLLPLPDAIGSVSVPVRRLDDILRPGERPALVKIDVEGFELEVWKGMGRVLATAPDLAVIVEFGPSHLVRAGIPIAEWIATFVASGFTPWEIAEETGDIRPLRKVGLDQVFSMNLLLLRADPGRWPRLRRT